MRLFAAVWPSAELVDKLLAVERDDRFRWIRRESLHVTLRFYGSLGPEEADGLMDQLIKIDQPAFTAHLGPETRLLKKQIVYVPVSGIEPLAEALGTENVLGHLTLARSKERVRHYEPVPFEAQWPIASFTLTKSLTLPEGAQYETVRTYSLDM